MNRKIIICMLCLCIPGAVIVFAEEGEQSLNSWFALNPHAGLYQYIKADLKTVFLNAFLNKIPLIFLTELMDEGAAKNITGSKIIEVLLQRVEQLKRMQELFESDRNCFREIAPGGKKNILFLKNWSLFQKRGISEKILREMLYFACDNKIVEERLLSGLRGVSGIPALSEIPEKQIMVLGTVLLESSLSIATFNSLGSLYVKGRLNNISSEEITHIIINALQSGKGLIRIEQEFNIRGRS